MRVDCGNQGVCSQGCRPHGCIRFGGTRHNWSLSSNFACNSLRASCRFVLVRDAVSLVFWNCMRNWGRARYWGGRCRAGRARAKSIRGCVGKENGGTHRQRDRARTSSEIGRASVRISRTGPYLGVPSWIQGAYGHLYLGPLSRACIEGLHRRLDVGIIGHRGSHLGALFVSPRPPFRRIPAVS